jgi:hypothetical protein
MTLTQRILRIEFLLGRPGSPGHADVARPDFHYCVDFVELITAGAGPVRLLRTPWEDSDEAVTVCVGSEFGVLLGLDFPAGEDAGPDGAWVRAHGNEGPVRWRMGLRQAQWIWDLLRLRAAARAYGSVTNWDRKLRADGVSSL